MNKSRRKSRLLSGGVVAKLSASLCVGGVLVAGWGAGLGTGDALGQTSKMTPAVLQAPDAQGIYAATGSSLNDADTVRQKLATHAEAVHVLDGWIRDPYITIGPDGWYYLTGTTPNDNDPRNTSEPYNTGLDEREQMLRQRPSIVGHQTRVWKSQDLAEWVYVGNVFDMDQGFWPSVNAKAFDSERDDWRLWAPELHWIQGRWHVVHTTPAPVNGGANLAVAKPEAEVGLSMGPFEHPLGKLMRHRHDPSLYEDDDGTVYLLWGNTMIAPIKKDWSGFAQDPVRIDPSSTRPNPRGGEPIRVIGHEGATMAKVNGRYIHFGTAWSTDRMRQGSYNLYFCTSDKPTGPYGPRQFVGRFLGHGTPFQDKEGRWWCTAFYNADVPPLPATMARGKDLSETAQTINRQGVTLVPLKVTVLDNGDVSVRAIDPDYANPGPDEAQSFEHE